MASDNLSFYQHFFEESLFLVPEKGALSAPTSPVSLVSEPEPLISGDTTAGPRYEILGENRRGLVIVVSVPDPEFRALPRHDFLTKVLAAIKFGLPDVGFINMPRGQKLNLFDLGKETQVNFVVAFGPGLLDMESDGRIHLYKPAAIGSIPLLIGDPLESIEHDVNRKKALWGGLQTIFIK